MVSKGCCLGNGCRFTLNRQREDPRDYQYEPTKSRALLGPSEYVPPPKYSLEPVLPATLNQGTIAACAANAASNVVKHALGLAFQPSRLHIYYYARLLETLPLEDDCGTTLRSVCQAATKYGVIDETQHPYKNTNVSKKPPDGKQQLLNACSAYVAVPQTLKHLTSCLREGRPIIFGIQVFPSALSQAVNKSGVIPMPKPDERAHGGHALLLVGYDDTTRCFTIQNTWGQRWGRKGFGTLPYDFVLSKELAFDFWTLY